MTPTKKILLTTTLLSFAICISLIWAGFEQFKAAIGKSVLLLASLLNNRSPILVDVNNQRLVTTVDGAFFAASLFAIILITLILGWITYRSFVKVLPPEDAGTFDTRVARWLHDLRKQRNRSGFLTVGLALLILVLAFQIFDRILPVPVLASSPPTTVAEQVDTSPAPEPIMELVAPPIIPTPTVEVFSIEQAMATRLSELRACIADRQACGPTNPIAAQRELNELNTTIANSMAAFARTEENYSESSITRARQGELSVELSILRENNQAELYRQQTEARLILNQRQTWDGVLDTVARGLALFASMFFFGTSLRMYRETDSRISELNELAMAIKFSEMNNLNIADTRKDLKLRDFDNRLDPNSMELSFAKAFENASLRVIEKIKSDKP